MKSNNFAVNHRANRKRAGITPASRVTAARIASNTSEIARMAFITGNAAGIHGGSRPKYGKRERQAVRKEERQRLDY